MLLSLSLVSPGLVLSLVSVSAHLSLVLSRLGLDSSRSLSRLVLPHPVPSLSFLSLCGPPAPSAFEPQQLGVVHRDCASSTGGRDSDIYLCNLCGEFENNERMVAFEGKTFGGETRESV